MAVASAGPYASLHLAPDNHANTPPLKALKACRVPKNLFSSAAVLMCIMVYCFVYRSINFDVMHYLYDFV